MPSTNVLSDGLDCFSAGIDADCAHSYIVMVDRKLRDMPLLRWGNTVFGNLKTTINADYKSFRFGKYAAWYLGAGLQLSAQSSFPTGLACN
jgi:hypothetical protein